MRIFILPLVIGLLSVVNFESRSHAQDSNLKSLDNGDALFGQRVSNGGQGTGLSQDPMASVVPREIEGSFSADESPTAAGPFSSIESSVDGVTSLSQCGTKKLLPMAMRFQCSFIQRTRQTCDCRSHTRWGDTKGELSLLDRR